MARHVKLEEILSTILIPAPRFIHRFFHNVKKTHVKQL